MQVRSLERADTGGAAAMLGRAFFDDPVFRAIVPSDAQRRDALPALFGEWIRLLHLGDGCSVVAEDLSGVALWSPPGRWHLGLSHLARMAPRMLGALGRRTWPALRVLHAIDGPHPEAPHNYLRAIGCDPTRQGQGVGAALLAPMLERCDARGEPAYLESSNERNLPFYRRHGFEVTGEIVTHLGPKAWPMWRAPRARRA